MTHLIATVVNTAALTYEDASDTVNIAAPTSEDASGTTGAQVVAEHPDGKAHLTAHASASTAPFYSDAALRSYTHRTHTLNVLTTKVSHPTDFHNCQIHTLQLSSHHGSTNERT